jgi:hypothetical protein
MCNPRRIRVRATRQLAVAWEREVRRRVVRTGLATGEARVREPLRGAVGAPTLAALPGVLARTEGWEEVDDAFRHEIEGGYVSYRPAEGVLEIVATASVEVRVEGEAAETVRGRVDGTVEGEGEGLWCDDNWGGRDRPYAAREAREALESALRAASEARVREAGEAAGAAIGAGLQAKAAARADEALAAESRLREAALRERAELRITAVGVRARNLFHQALASAYRDVVLAYARSRGAEHIRCSESADGVLEIDFELQI